MIKKIALLSALAASVFALELATAQKKEIDI